MVRKQIIQLHDDLDGSEAHETVHFALDGKHFEIDLTNEHAQQLRDSLGRFIGVARVSVPARPIRTTLPRTSAPNKERLAAIRAWAKAHGRHVADRGRIPQRIIDDYDAAHR